MHVLFGHVKVEIYRVKSIEFLKDCDSQCKFKTSLKMSQVKLLLGSVREHFGHIGTVCRNKWEDFIYNVQMHKNLSVLIQFGKERLE